MRAGRGCWSTADRMPIMARDRKSTRLNSSHSQISYAVFCLKKKKKCDNVISHFDQRNSRSSNVHNAQIIDRATHYSCSASLLNTHSDSPPSTPSSLHNIHHE